MGLFSTCALCGKKKLSLLITSDGLCSSCYDAITKEKEKFDVSSFAKQQESDYTPPAASTDEPVYLFIDVETTGLNPAKDAIVQISALRFFGQKAVDGLNSYVNPQCPIPWKATEIHGITDEKVQDAPTIDKIKEPFMNLAKGAILVGHNVTFDLNFLDHVFHGALDGMEYIDTLWVAKKVLDLPNYRLETLADYAEFYPEGGFHDSLTDCTATAAIFFRLAFDKPGLAQIYHSKASAKVESSFSGPVHYKEIVPHAVPTDVDHPLYGKRIVFTGELSITRREAAQMAVDVGANVTGSISGKVDYVVAGVPYSETVGPDGMSGKLKKARELNALGKASIEIISEDEFMSLLKGGVPCG